MFDIDIHYHYVRDLIEDKQIRIRLYQYNRRKKFVDILTKNLDQNN